MQMVPLKVETMMEERTPRAAPEPRSGVPTRPREGAGKELLEPAPPPHLALAEQGVFGRGQAGDGYVNPTACLTRGAVHVRAVAPPR